MHDLPLPEEFDDIVHIRVVGKPENVVICHPGLLLCCQTLHQIRHRIALDRHGSGTPGESRGSCGVDTGCVIHKIGRESGVLHLGILQIPGQLVNNRPNHLQVPQLFGSCFVFILRRGKKFLRQYRIMGQVLSARDFVSSESVENGGILDVFSIFHTARLGL